MKLRQKQRKPYLVREVGEWVFTFHYKEGSVEKTFLSIVNRSGLMNIRIGGNTEAYGYLLAAAQQNLDSQLQGYAVTLFVPAMMVTQDQTLCDDITMAIDAWLERRNAEAEAEAEAVTEEQEQSAQVFMEDVAEYADAKTHRERREKRELWERELKEEIGNHEVEV